MVKCSLYMCYFSQVTQCACNNTCYNKTHNSHLGLVVVISIIGSPIRCAQIKFHSVHNSSMSLDLHKT